MDRRVRTKAEIAAIFGDDLPLTTSDERDPGGSLTGTRAAVSDSLELLSSTDRWLTENCPPHHGG